MSLFSTSLLPVRLVVGTELIALLPNTVTLKPHRGRKHRWFPRSRWRLPNSRGQGSHCCCPSLCCQLWLHCSRHRWEATAPHHKGRAQEGAPKEPAPARLPLRGPAARLSINDWCSGFKNNCPGMQVACLLFLLVHHLLTAHGWRLSQWWKEVPAQTPSAKSFQ